MNKRVGIFSGVFRNRLSEKLMELGNIIGGVMVFGQFLPSSIFSVSIFIAGFILMLVCYIGSYFISL